MCVHSQIGNSVITSEIPTCLCLIYKVQSIVYYYHNPLTLVLLHFVFSLGLRSRARVDIQQASMALGAHTSSHAYQDCQDACG